MRSAPRDVRTARVSPPLVDLADALAVDSSVVGAKAGSLARSLRAGLPVLPGFVLTVDAARRGADDPDVVEALELAWSQLRRHHYGPLVVRSSSTVEDAAESSMAGQFTSVLDVYDMDSLRVAVDRVIDSARRVPGAQSAQPMAVLVQGQLDLVVGGVMFGLDPVSGDRHHVVVDAVASRVDDLVSGRVTAAHYVLSRHGRVIEVVHPEVAPALSRSQRRRLVHLARTAERVFGSVQDLEWAIDREDRLWLLQSRPVTAVTAPVSSPVLGTGPVAETFPFPLRTLETDLWIEPLRDALMRSLETTRAVSRRRLRSSVVLTMVGGFPAVDLGLLGVVRAHRARWRLLDPRPGAHRLLAAWRVGRLRVALPQLTADLVWAVDEDLTAVGALEGRTEADLRWLLEASRRELATVHTMEILTGMLTAESADDMPLPELALRALASGRTEGLSDAEIVVRNPEVLALLPPSLERTIALPATEARFADGEHRGIDSIGDRDALRLRVRWLQELLARIARELAHRLAARGVLADAVAAEDCTVAELSAIVLGGAPPSDLHARAAVRAGPPLPATFRLTSSGDVVPRVTAAGGEGTPAGGGRGIGTVGQTTEDIAPGAGSVLVVTNLEPQLAGVLPGLAGLVAETGSPLSHLAILAREMHVPTVVAVPDARRRFPPGTRVVVDGSTGEVSVLAQEVGP